MYFRPLIYSSLILIQSCTTLSLNETWPAEIPPQSIFVESCKNNNGCTTQDQTKDHLVWIKRFYLGSILYPTGWNEISDRLLATLDNQAIIPSTTERLDNLGLEIVTEWAKDNRVRLIDSKLLSIWGNALAASAENNEQIEFITQIENDVEQILNGTLKAEEISSDRYYTVEDYDNF